jgi:hypothetical protein
MRKLVSEKANLHEQQDSWDQYWNHGNSAPPRRSLHAENIYRQGCSSQKKRVLLMLHFTDTQNQTM